VLRSSGSPMPSTPRPGGKAARDCIALVVLMLSGLLLGGCEQTESVQWGERGTGMVHVDKLSRLLSGADPHGVPDPEPRDPPDPEIPLAKDVNENVQVLTDLDALEFARLMQAISTWVSPEQGCEYCHDTENLASDEKYTKIVARQMLQMTRDINTNWKSHVAGTGVTCWTCHRGQAVPSGTWFGEPGPQTPSARTTGTKAGQNTAGMQTIGNAALPFDPLTPFLSGDYPISVQGTTALPSENRSSIKQAEWTYALMMYMSNSLGVNCTFCHQTRAMGIWEESTPQRVTAWHGIRMVRDINGAYLSPMKALYPETRLGSTGDPGKVGCETCHKGAFKPLLGVSMLGDYPELAGYRTVRFPAAPESETPPAMQPPVDEVVAEVALGAVPETDTVPEVVADAVPETETGIVPEKVADAVPEVVSDAETETQTETGIVLEVVADAVPETETGIVPQMVADEVPGTGDDAAEAMISVPDASAAAPSAVAAMVPEAAPVVVAQTGDASLPETAAPMVDGGAAIEASALALAALDQVERRLAAAEARLIQERTALQQQLVVVRAQRDAAMAESQVKVAEAAQERAKALRAAEARLDQEGLALQQQLKVVRAQRDAAAAEVAVQVTRVERDGAAALRAAEARLDQERLALQQQLNVVRAQRDATAAEIAVQVARVEQDGAAALRAAEARLDQERLALQQQLEVVRAQRDATAAGIEIQVARVERDGAAALRAAEARLDQERLALQQQLEVVRAQRDATAAEIEIQVARVEREKAAALRAAEARLDQERLALQQQLGVVRARRDAVAADAEAQLIRLAEDRASALRAAEARLNQERTALQQQLVLVRSQRDAALANPDAKIEIAALTDEVEALRVRLAETDDTAKALRARLQAAHSEHARELADAKESIVRMRALYAGVAELGGRITEEGILVNLGGEELQFPSGSAVLPARDLPTLDRVAAMLAERPDLKAKIAGHTDSSGNPEINQDLSRQRAESVMQALIARGVDPSRLATEGYGADRPVADNSTERGRRENRRVERRIPETLIPTA
jgi:outer membrane protein OmpA-like peptidoglycan-associated protein